MKKKTRVQAITLLEIMIVIFLIGLIGSVVGYNMKGSIDKGKAFKTEQAIQRIRDILNLEIAKGVDIKEAILDVPRYLKSSGMVKDPDKFINDGWGKPFVFSIDEQEQEVVIVSSSLDAYLARTKPSNP